MNSLNSTPWNSAPTPIGTGGSSSRPNSKWVRRWLGPCGWTPGALLCLFLATVSGKATDGAPLVESVHALQSLIASPTGQVARVELTALVLGVDAVHAGLALQDSSGCAWIEVESLPAEIEPGMKVALTGNALLGRGAARLGFSRLIDINYGSGLTFDSTRIHLRAGYHPFELRYSQSDGPTALNLRILGPGLPTNALADLLFHRDAGAERKPGAAYSYLEGVDHEGPLTNVVASGVASNIDVSVAKRTNQFALHFRGELKIPQEGNYEFQLRADDSASLILPSDASCAVVALGKAPLSEPLRLLPGQRMPEGQDPCWAEVEGIVKHAGMHASNLHLELAAEVGRMQVVIAGVRTVPAALLVNSRVRVTGLVQGTFPPGQPKVAGAMLVPGIGRLAILNPPETSWMAHSTTRIQDLGNPGVNRIVRVRGTVAGVVPGWKLVIRDETGQIEAMTPRAEASMEGSAVDLLGCFSETNRLSFVAHRSEVQTPAQREKLPTLTTIEQIRRLRPEEVTRAYPVKFQGVVTFVFHGGLRAHVQGEREGIYIACANNAPQPLNVGDLCEFEGYSSKGAFSPVATYRVRRLLGRGHVPEPLRPEWSQLANGSLDSQWVEVEGLVISVRGRDLVLGLRGGELSSRVFEGDPAELASLRDSVVRVRGTIRGFANARAQQNRVLLQVTSPGQITVCDPAPDDPFAIPEKSFAELHEFDANAAALRRVRSRGQVVHVRDGIAYLSDGTNGMRVSARSSTRFAPGDIVEVVGFPQMEGFTLSMRQALVRVVGREALPAPLLISAEDMYNRVHDSKLVKMQATLVSVRTNQSDYLIELQAGRQNFLARLDAKLGALPLAPVGSKVQIAGLYTTGSNVPNRTNQLRTFELLLNSPADLTIVETPPWWNLRKVLSLLGLMTLILVLSAVWISALRRRVEQRTRELRSEIDVRRRTQQDLEERTLALQREIQERKQVQQQLEEKKTRLENEIEERRRMEQEVEKVNQQLVHASRLAGQAEVASSVLHNVGNVLNSVNISASIVASGLKDWKSINLVKAAEMLKNRRAIFEGLPTDDSLRLLPDYLQKFAAYSDSTRTTLIREVADLSQNVDHIKKIVAMQQNYARVAGVSERVDPAELMESAFKINARAYERHGIAFERRFSPAPELTIDRHKVLQILVNLLQNAKDACKAKGGKSHRVIGRIEVEGESVVFEIADTGIGISPENMKQLFSHGFTTRKDGHGFGLHSAALAAKELGGAVTAASEGIGSGATFTVRIPVGKTATTRPELAPLA